MASRDSFAFLIVIGWISVVIADSYGSSYGAATTEAPDKGGDFEGPGRTCGLPGSGSIEFSSKSSTNLSDVFPVKKRSHLVFPTIVGGTLAVRNQLCWQVTLSMDLGDAVSSCGGAIIGPSTILTAAHCFYPDKPGPQSIFANQVTVVTGALKSDARPKDDPSGCSESYSVTKLTPHPQYDPKTVENDIAVLTLDREISFVDKPCQCLVCLENREPKVGDLCLISGTGLEASESKAPSRPMKFVGVPILRNIQSLCSMSNLATDQAQTLCAGGNVGKDSCQGDSGGPLVCSSPLDQNLYSAGVVSHGIGCGGNKGGKYTKTKFYLPWILKTAAPDTITIDS
ncbi:putative Transmembrane protease serine 6 [Hypsibius exemplaris]|uniref:Transmembrane protease serine 6 n=1 Tax=Hypsibius exemplaris TaxID=2072580 RepID=A0A1W0WLQ2_HYPEX|nr:putative Transmembrane protease serine 6 [Hypsibius exemplaris]